MQAGKGMTGEGLLCSPSAPFASLCGDVVALNTRINCVSSLPGPTAHQAQPASRSCKSALTLIFTLALCCFSAVTVMKRWKVTENSNWLGKWKYCITKTVFSGHGFKFVFFRNCKTRRVEGGLGHYCLPDGLLNERISLRQRLFPSKLLSGSAFPLFW